MNQEKRLKCIFKCAVCRVNIGVVLNFIPNINTTETNVSIYVYSQLLLGCLNFDYFWCCDY